MGLSVGTRLGPYEILAPLGAGGMGEVYRARDTRLGRSVAIKVLPDAVAANGDELRRLELEAQLLASLNHPHIAVLHGIEDAQGSLALVMELVEGPTLAERIMRGPISIDEAIAIARQIAEALEYAHEHGIVHRDLKPANIKLLADGSVKVLDFGLAKVLERAPASSNVVTSPTLSAVATKMGVILGTAAYMSPEQAKGKPVDRRCDIWSFGCVLYEMLTGKMAFAGETVTDILAAIVRAEPDWAALPQETPASVRSLLERCLRKDVKSRLQAIGDARVALEEAASGQAEPSGSILPVAQPKISRWALLSPLVALVVLGVAALFFFWRPWQSPAREQPIHVTADWGADGYLYTIYGAAAVLSPDGSRIAYVVRDAKGKRQLYIRSLNQLEATPLPGTDGARDPFFSPDGEWVGFFAEEKLKKVAIAGGAVVTLCDIRDDRGGTWGEDGTIIYAPWTRTDLFRVPAGGGAPVPFSHRRRDELTHRWPEFLPGGKVVIYTSSDDGNNYENADIVAQVIATGERKQIYHGGYGARYVHGGFFVFMHEGTLFGAKFDEHRLALTSQPAPLLEHVATNFGNAGTQFSIAASGLAVYISGTAGAEQRHIEWLTSDGKTSLLTQGLGAYWFMSFSPDGKYLALSIEAGGSQDIWVYDWKRNLPTRLTFGGGLFPAWTPDSRGITYVSDDRNGNFSLWWKRADGGGDAQRLLQSKNRFGSMAWRPDGKVLVFTQNSEKNDLDLMWVTVEGDERTGWKVSEPKIFLNTPGLEDSPAFSPDGKWLAYHSNESGAPQVYVRPFPGPGGRWQVSNGDWEGLPEWSRSGHQLFYYDQSKQRIMVAGYSDEGDTLRFDTPRAWSEIAIPDSGGLNRNFAVSPDGKRVAAMREPSGEQQPASRVTFLVSFADEIRTKLGAARH